MSPTYAPRELFERYAAAVAYVVVEAADGSPSIGAAFHVGDNVFLTARHVVEDRRITEIATTVRPAPPKPADHPDLYFKGRFLPFPTSPGAVRSGPFFHPDPLVDVAALVVDGIDAPAIPLGTHLDDWINDEAFLLRDIVVMGYPPVPQSTRPLLVASRAEVNAVADLYSAPHPHFVVSAIARGGFSGGPCLIEWDFALGMVTRSLTDGDQPAENGYMAVVSVEPLRTCLEHHGLLPASQAMDYD